MSPPHKIRTGSLLLSACLLVSGCFAQGAPEDAPPGSLPSVPYTTLDGPISGNGLTPADLWAPESQAALRALGGGPLLDGAGKLAPTPLLDTPSGLSVLRYTLGCALGESVAVESAAGEVFNGALDLAPAWASRALTVPEQRWMTACLLTHLNVVGAHVPIMLQGSHPALVPAPGEDTESYTASDMTVFGNLFLARPEVYACADINLLDCGLNVSISENLLLRLCGLLPTCSDLFRGHVGPCALYCSHDAEGNPTCAPLLGATYAEAISTKLEQTLSAQIPLLCSP